MEARGIIDEVILQKDIYGGRSLQHNRLAISHPELCSGEDDGLYALLFQEFQRRAHELPILFNTKSPAVALRPSASVIRRLVSMLSGGERINGDIASNEVFKAANAFGWAYQYWNAEEKDRVFERARTERVKIEGKDIIPVTCIYTEPYMVKFLVQNSLGAQWSCMHPESHLYEKWKYYETNADRSPVDFKPVREITFLDPACGSGHFFLEAFDLFYDMYVEEGEFSRPEEICTSILEHNLHGIDIDERSVQISIAVLWMKAKEKAPELDTSGLSGFHDHLLATNIRLPKGRDHLEEFLKKHPEDRPLRSALESILKALENVDEIGSLLKFEEPLEQAFEDLRTDHGIQTSLWSNGFTSLDSWQENVITQLRKHFNEEAVSSDLSQAYFGQSMNKGLKFFELLSSKYDVVATNPPYLGSGNMNIVMKKYLEHNYNFGKHDLFAAFIIRCIEYSKEQGHLGMVTQQSWMFLKRYAKFRGGIKGENILNNKKFNGILNSSSIEVIMDLGTGAFREIMGEVVNVVLFTSSKSQLINNHYIICFKAYPVEQFTTIENKIMKIINKPNNNAVNKIMQSKILNMPDYILSYWLDDKFVNLFINNKKVSDYGKLNWGISSSNNNRFLRWFWENNNTIRWIKHTKGGKYCKWFGYINHLVDWSNNGIKLKSFILERYPYLGTNYEIKIRPYTFNKAGWSYSAGIKGCIGVRLLLQKCTTNAASPALYLDQLDYKIGAILNSRIMSYLLRAINTKIKVDEGYVGNLPLPSNQLSSCEEMIKKCVNLKKDILSKDITQSTYDYNIVNFNASSIIQELKLSTILHTYEGIIEYFTFQAYDIGEDLKNQVVSETGNPVGWYSLIEGYTSIDDFIDLYNIDIKNNMKYINKISVSSQQIDEIINNVKYLFENNLNPKTNQKIYRLKNRDEKNNYIPSETFLEELSSLTEIHPISLYWLLNEGIRKGGWRCRPRERNIIQDKVTAIILRLLGYRWPKEIEEGGLVKDWSDSDGIIPLTGDVEESNLLNRIRKRINEEFKEDSLTFEREFEELMGKPLEAWLLYDFYKHHIQQFKKRPLAWQIQSSPSRISRRGRGQKVMPTFACMVYCQKVDGDTFHKIRSQYVGPLKNGYEAELRTLDTIGLLNTEQTVRRTRLDMLIDELEKFDAKLEKVITKGFDSKKLIQLCEDESLDRWCSIDGEVSSPDNREELYLQERAYVPDINDGVRVNIAPLQKVGLLASDVLASKDVEKAISDRAEWRADERRWCREGKLPQPGWWRKEGAE